MRYRAAEKLEIIRLVEESRMQEKRTLEKLGVSRSKFFRWDNLNRRFGAVGLEDRPSAPGRVWYRVPDQIWGQVIDLALERPEPNPRELAVTFTDEKAQLISETSVYRLLRAKQLQTSSAFIFMKAADVTETVEMALAGSGLNGSRHRPRRLCDNGQSYVAGDLATWLDKPNTKHARGAPNYPMMQGKIERWHLTMRNRILLENYFLLGDIEAKIGWFVDHCNHCRCHESIGHLTPAEVYAGRVQAALEWRETIRR